MRIFFVTWFDQNNNERYMHFRDKKQAKKFAVSMSQMHKYAVLYFDELGGKHKTTYSHGKAA